MKSITIYTGLILLTNTVMLNAQNVNIPDANFKAELVGNADINTNGDAEIQLTEAQAYSDELEVDGKNIADLTGIEAFVNIEKLDCSDNQLTSLDVSANIMLEELKCSNNQLTMLNVSMNTGLEELDCSGNQLTSLDVSANISMEELDCSGNQLITLDLTANASLEEFNCSNNQLTRLNVKNGNNINMSDFNSTGNPNLTCVDVDNPAYSIANWTDIDAGTTFSSNCTTSIHAINAFSSDMVVFPSPVVTELNLSMKGAMMEMVEILDMTGRVVEQHTTHTMNYTLEVRNLPTGIYLVKIRTVGGEEGVQRFVKQ